MSGIRIVLGLVIGGALVVGCKKEPAPPAPSVPTPTAPAAPVPPVSAAPTPTPTPPAPPTSPTPLPIPPATPTPPATSQNPTSLPPLPTPPLTTTTPGTSTASPADAKDLLADAEKNVEAKKWDAAGDDFKKLNAMKGQLSPEMKDALSVAETKFVAAKAGSGLKLPGFGVPTTQQAPPEPNK